MSTSPATLTALSAFWRAQGGVMLGIVGNKAHTSGYHLGKDRIFDGAGPGIGWNDYSVKLPRDKAGLTNAASAIDLGKLGGSLANLRTFSKWLVGQCIAKADATGDIREIIYSPDGVKVQRYSGVDGKIHTGPGNGDLSHRTHTHLSYFRDSQARSKVPAFAPYFATPEDTVKSFIVPEQHTLAMIKDGTWLYQDNSLAANPQNINLSPARELVLVGTFSAEVSIVAYETPAGDANAVSNALFVRTADIAGTSIEVPCDQADLDAANAKGYATAKAKATAAVGAI